MREESGHVGSHKVGWFELCVARLILSAQKVFKTDLHLFFNFYLFIYLFLVVLGLRCYARAFSRCGELLFIAVHGLLIAEASLVEHRF